MSAAPTRVVVAERDKETAATLAAILAEAGYAVTVCLVLDEAIRAVQRQVSQLVLTDSFSAVRSHALANAGRLLPAAAGIPVVLLTAHQFSEDEVLAAGFAAYLMKPFDLDELLATVAACLPSPAG